MPEQFLEYRVYGPYVSKTDGRSRVVLYDKNRQKQTMSYPKYLWWKHKGVLIADNEQIHHKDEDHTNNSIDNFEVVLHREHMSLHINPPETVKCIWCEKDFELIRGSLSNHKTNRKRGKAGPFCSRSCTGKYGAYIMYVEMGKKAIGGRKTNTRKLAEKLYERRQQNA